MGIYLHSMDVILKNQPRPKFNIIVQVVKGVEILCQPNERYHGTVLGQFYRSNFRRVEWIMITIDNETAYVIIYCLNSIRRDGISTYKTSFSEVSLLTSIVSLTNTGNTTNYNSTILQINKNKKQQSACKHDTYFSLVLGS